MVKRLLLVLPLLVLGAGACSDNDGRDGAAEATTTSSAPPTPRSTSTTVLKVASVSFSERAAPAGLGEGWAAAKCEGEAPMVCITRGEQAVGRLELAVFPVSSFTLPGFQEAVAAGDTTKALTILAEDFVRTFSADRKDGCGVDYEIEASEPAAATVLGKPGLRYGFVGKKGGTLVERQISHGTIDGDEVVLVNAPSYAPDGCVPPEGEFTPEALDAFEPFLRGVVAASTR